MPSIGNKSLSGKEAVIASMEAGYRRIEGTLAALQSGPRGRVVSSTVTVSSWQDRPTWLSSLELRAVAISLHADLVDNRLLMVLTGLYREGRFDQRLAPAFIMDGDDLVAILAKKPS